MGIKDLLIINGSSLTAYDGKTPHINPLATGYSILHADGNKPGYSLNGSNFNKVNSYYNSYLDGAVNNLPRPSQLDLDGKTPSRYLDNLPE
jgi:hypothetical protein